ncbi:hypothetical protein JQ596_33340 [Bradyrhizobium manausense]|uniref:hypothetical protein n=1 Tax=Bradyrhizobium manausense TaxID=989370 RepID=UPI001BA48C06|nr:hypothetical protein [Bradyrhizobium manausense]MBR0830404.1 hypothetical protein [Bradyrhizobium manausense]
MTQSTKMRCDLDHSGISAARTKLEDAATSALRAALCSGNNRLVTSNGSENVPAGAASPASMMRAASIASKTRNRIRALLSVLKVTAPLLDRRNVALAAGQLPLTEQALGS